MLHYRQASRGLGADTVLALNSQNVPSSQDVGSNMQQHVFTVKTQEEKEASAQENLLCKVKKRLWNLTSLESTVRRVAAHSPDGVAIKTQTLPLMIRSLPSPLSEQRNNS